MVAARGDVTTLRVLTKNTGTLCDIEVQTPGGRMEYAGSARIDGVPGTAAPVEHQLSRYRGLGVRRAVPDRQSRRSLRRRRGHLHRQRHAGGGDAGRGSRASPATRPATSSMRMPHSRSASNRSGCRPARDEARRRDEEGRAEDVPGGEADAPAAPHHHAHLHSARLPFGGRRARRGDRGHRRGDAGHRGAPGRRWCRRARARHSRCSTRPASSRWCSR